jgi:hypothetical protein
MDHSDLDPQRLKPGLKTGSRLKPNLVRPSYTGGTPTAADQVKPTLLDKAGNLKPGLASDGNLKASLLQDDAPTTGPTTYLRPDATCTYKRPDSISKYERP